MKVAFIGPKQYSESLRLIGFDCFEAESEKETTEMAEDLKKKDYGIIFASSDVLNKEIEGVIILPGLVEKSEIDSLNKIFKKAIGKEIKIV